jgi:hypothetical protein
VRNSFLVDIYTPEWMVDLDSQKQIYNQSIFFYQTSHEVKVKFRRSAHEWHVHIFLSIITFHLLVWFGLWVFNATFNNISVISWRSVLLVEETGVPGEKYWPVASHWQTLSHKVVSSTPHLGRFSNSTLVVIGTDCIGSYKSNYHTITTRRVAPYTPTRSCVHIGVLKKKK